MSDTVTWRKTMTKARDTLNKALSGQSEYDLAVDVDSALDAYVARLEAAKGRPLDPEQKVNLVAASENMKKRLRQSPPDIQQVLYNIMQEGMAVAVENATVEQARAGQQQACEATSQGAPPPDFSFEVDVEYPAPPDQYTQRMQRAGSLLDDILNQRDLMLHIQDAEEELNKLRAAPDHIPHNEFDARLQTHLCKLQDLQNRLVPIAQPSLKSSTCESAPRVPGMAQPGEPGYEIQQQMLEAMESDKTETVLSSGPPGIVTQEEAYVDRIHSCGMWTGGGGWTGMAVGQHDNPAASIRVADVMRQRTIRGVGLDETPPGLDPLTRVRYFYYLKAIPEHKRQQLYAEGGIPAVQDAALTLARHVHPSGLWCYVPRFLRWLMPRRRRDVTEAQIDKLLKQKCGWILSEEEQRK